MTPLHGNLLVGGLASYMIKRPRGLVQQASAEIDFVAHRYRNWAGPRVIRSEI